MCWFWVSTLTALVLMTKEPMCIITIATAMSPSAKAAG